MPRPILSLPRPLMQKTIVELREIYTKDRANKDSLKMLERELNFRRVPRAQTLLKEVQEDLRLYGSKENENIRVSLPLTASETKKTEVLAPSPIKPEPVSQVNKSPKGGDNVVRKSAATTSIDDVGILRLGNPTLELTEVEAFNFLKIKAGSAWHEIENARRKIVELANPEFIANISSDVREKLMLQAKFANAAYRVLQTLSVEFNQPSSLNQETLTFEKENHPITEPETALAERILVASDMAISFEAQHRLKNDEDIEVRLALAKNVNCASDVLQFLWEQVKFSQNAGASSNQNFVIDADKDDPDDADKPITSYDIINALALNRATPIKILEEIYFKFWKGCSETGRIMVENVSCPASVLAELHYFADIGSKHRNFSKDAYRKVLLREIETDDDVQIVAAKEDLPVDLLVRLAIHENLTVMKYVAKNPNTPFEKLNEMRIHVEKMYWQLFSGDMDDFLTYDSDELEQIDEDDLENDFPEIAIRIICEYIKGNPNGPSSPNSIRVAKFK